jgi:ribosomal protein S15P/S13E
MNSRSHRLYFNNTVRRDCSSPGRTGSTSTMSCATTTRLPVARALPHALSRRSTSHWSCVRSLHLAARLLVVRIAPALLRLCCASGRAISTLDLSSVGRTDSRRVPSHSIVRRDYPSRDRNGYTSLPPRVRVPQHVARLVTRLVAPLVVDYSTSRGSSRGSLRCSLSTTHLAQARRRLLRLRRASGCLGTSRDSSRVSSRRSLSTTPPRSGSLSTTSPPPRVRVPWHVARLVMRLVAPLVIDYSASRRLVVDYFASVVRPGASARRAARHASGRTARRRLLRLVQARRRLLRFPRTSGCLGTSRGSSRGSSRRSSSTTPRHTARPAARRRLLRLAQSRRRLLRLRRASGCLGTSRGLSRGLSHRSSSTTPRAGSSSTTSPLSRVRVARHVARLVTRLVAPLIVDYSASRRLVVDYFASVARPGASAHRAAHHASRRVARCRLLRLAQACRRLLCLPACLGASARRAGRCVASRRLLCLA